MKQSQLTNSAFGLKIENVDCAKLTDNELTDLGRLLHKHQLLVFPDQQSLSPKDEVRVNRGLAPSADTVWRDQQTNPWEVFKVAAGNTAGTWQIPDEPGVLVIGKGRYIANGLDVMLGGARGAYGKQSGSQVLGGGLLQWHIDGAFYREEPCRVGQMRCLEVPPDGPHWIDYGESPVAGFSANAGATVFASGRIAWQKLDVKTQRKVRNLNAHYAAHPFKHVSHLANNDTGLRVVDETAESNYQSSGADVIVEEQHDSDTKVYPLIWGCPITAKPALMIHPRCLSHFVNTESNYHYGRRESRFLAETLMRPAIDATEIVIHNWKPGDLVVWNNHSVWHSATGGLQQNDRRVMHLTAFNGLKPPIPY
jgi:alpha-ketoglutarate-dependent taurine dioxygenase